ncbi:MAG: hypothetical protein JNL82_18775 [Myxococcales bacterium]|jgi:hypothetical protein|nr:hypothetical protein [Myxococcales bacterium]
MPITTKAVYCPGRVPESESLADNMLDAFKDRIHRRVLWGGERGPNGGRYLPALTRTAVLYLLVHAHGMLSAFSFGRLTWTADQLAALMHDDGLPLDHQFITLLTCRAGLSFASKARVAKARQLQAEKTRAEQRGDLRAVADITARYGALVATRPPPEPYTRTDQMLPLAADLARALGALGHRSLVITSYKLPVAAFFSSQAGREIGLEDERRNAVSADNSPQYRVVWRSS